MARRTMIAVGIAVLWVLCFSIDDGGKIGQSAALTVEAAVVDPPDTLMAADYPNDNGEWVLLTFDPSTSKVDRYRIYREITIVSATDTTEAVKMYMSWAEVPGPGALVVGEDGYITVLVATLGIVEPSNYKIVAEVGGESSAFTNAATAAGIDNIPPAAITALSAFDTPDDAGGSITVSWTLSPDDRVFSYQTSNFGQHIAIRGVTAYNIYRKAAGEEFVKVGSVGHGVNTYQDRTAENNTEYVYDVRAADSNNEVASGLEAVAFAAINEGIPTGLVATAYTDSVRLDWNANMESDLHAYYIYRDTSSPASTLLDSVVAQSPPDTFYTDTAVVSGTTYYYRITALDSVGSESGYSDEVSATPTGAPDISLSATSHNFGDIQVGSSSTWTLVVSNTGESTLSVSNISSNDPQFTASPTSFSVPAGGSQNVTVTFAPTSTGSQSATLTITSNDPDEGNLQVSLSGRGVQAGILGDVNNTETVNITDALIVATYDLDSTITIPNNGDIRLGDVNKNNVVNITDALIIATYDIDPTHPNLPSGIGQPVGAGKLVVVSSEDQERYPENSIAVRLDCSETELEPGKTIEVAVHIDIRGVEEKLGAYSATLYWDPHVLSYAGYTGGSTEGFDHPLVMVEEGQLRLNQFNVKGAGGDVNTINVSFLVEGKIAGDPLSVEFSALTSAHTFHDLLPYLHVSSHQGGLSLGSASSPQTFSLFQNYPNPFNAETTIGYDLPVGGKVNLSVYDINGQRVRTLIDLEKEAGTYSVVWEGRDDEGREVASGIYLVRLKAHGFVRIRRMILIR